MTIKDRYASAIRTSNLRSKPDTRMSDSDVIGAAGLAGKATRHDGTAGSPLAMTLLRLFCGDNRASAELVVMMAGMLVGKAWHGFGLEMSRVEASDIAMAVLAWHRDGVCKACGGHGYKLVQCAPALSDEPCPECRGMGRIPFEKQFPADRRVLARWLLVEVERELSAAGPQAMSALAPKLDL